MAFGLIRPIRGSLNTRSARLQLIPCIPCSQHINKRDAHHVPYNIKRNTQIYHIFSIHPNNFRASRHGHSLGVVLGRSL